MADTFFDCPLIIELSSMLCERGFLASLMKLYLPTAVKR